MDKDLIPVNDSLVNLNESYLANLETYEDYLSFYIQLEQAETAYSWLKADTLLQMSQALGESSLLEVSKAVKKPLGTVINYVRTARAFPPDKREPDGSFSLHYQASYADSYDNESGEFKTEKRFDWIKKATEEHMHTRSLAEAIRQEKIDQGNGGEIVTCIRCTEAKPVKEYVLYTPGVKGQERFELCDDCHLKLVAFARGITA